MFRKEDKSQLDAVKVTQMRYYLGGDGVPTFS